MEYAKLARMDHDLDEHNGSTCSHCCCHSACCNDDDDVRHFRNAKSNFLYLN